MKAQRLRSYWAEAWQDPVSLLGQMAPAPGSPFRSSSPSEQSGWRVPGLKCRECGRAEHWKGVQVVCSKSSLDHESWPSSGTAACPQAGFLTGSFVSQQGCGAQVAALPILGLLLPGYFESWSSLAFCRILLTSVMG